MCSGGRPVRAVPEAASPSRGALPACLRDGTLEICRAPSIPRSLVRCTSTIRTGALAIERKLFIEKTSACHLCARPGVSRRAPVCQQRPGGLHGGWPKESVGPDPVFFNASARLRLGYTVLYLPVSLCTGPKIQKLVKPGFMTSYELTML